jgi:hypothetical protein
MTTKVTVKVEQTNGPVGKMLVGTVAGNRMSLSLETPPFELDYWAHGDVRIICREANLEDFKLVNPTETKSA